MNPDVVLAVDKNGNIDIVRLPRYGETGQAVH
jgi:hypothetical protein